MGPGQIIAWIVGRQQLRGGKQARTPGTLGSGCCRRKGLRQDRGPSWPSFDRLPAPRTSCTRDIDARQPAVPSAWGYEASYYSGGLVAPIWPELRTTVQVTVNRYGRFYTFRGCYGGLLHVLAEHVAHREDALNPGLEVAVHEQTSFFVR